MADLRWILLLAGLVFLAALAAWELRRPRQARRDVLTPPISPPGRSEPAIGELEHVDTEPSVPMPSIPMHASPGNPRVPVLAPPRVDLPALEPEELAVEPEPVTAVCIEQSPPAAVVAEGMQPMPSAVPVPPIVEWPPESERHIISVRVVGVNPDRMSGRPLRQALAACGFVHGRFGIFHQPGVDGRTLISAANLSKPGVFDPGNMDFQRFRGLGLFAVLPGPLPPAATLDHLLDTAGDLAQRLHARLLDEQGQPLDEVRLEALARTVQDMSNGALREPAA
jgi:FtsZ-interacting cell division protein ZipA